jgi:CorA-like Mg2+ transporter protein
MNLPHTEAPAIRHFREIVIWPIQLLPLRPGEQVQRHWRELEAAGEGNRWRRVVSDFRSEPLQNQERRYKEFVTFLPYVQRFLYGAAAGQEIASARGEPSINAFQRDDVAQVRVTLSAASTPIVLEVGKINLYFFLDADIAVVAFEMHTNDLSIREAQDLLFRFGRAYPAFWTSEPETDSCPHKVEWLGRAGEVLAVSDYENREKYLAFVGQFRSSAVAHHWAFLLEPLGLEYPGQTAVLRYRQLEHYRMPFMAYLALDDPARFSRGDFMRLALVTRPGEPDTLPYSEGTLVDFEKRYCEDRFWDRGGLHFRGDTRIVVTGQTLSFVGRHADPYYSDDCSGLLGQFRHQYKLLFLIAHFHRAALLSMSDELAVAMNRLTVGDPRSVRSFKRTIRQMMEVFLRFTHRYWFHKVSQQPLIHAVYERLTGELGNAEHYQEVRNEVTDMNQYLDSDSARRQANTVLRLTVVTIIGLIGTVASGLLGMNLIAEADRPVVERVLVFGVTLVGTVVLTGLSVVYSKQLADVLDSLSDTRLDWRSKWGAMRRTWRETR